MIKTGLCIDFKDMEIKIPWAIANHVESVSLTTKSSRGVISLDNLCERTEKLTKGSEITISTIGIYGNPLESEKDFEDLRNMILYAGKFHCNTVSTFAGAVTGRPVEESIGVFQEKFTKLARTAEDAGVRIAFENCLHQGSWDHATQNIAMNPRAWTMMFESVPSDALGLEWEPAHQIAQLADPVRQLRIWAGKVFHVHGKDARINRKFIRREGINGSGYLAEFCNPGNGETDWREIAAILKESGYEGSISLEPGHDPKYSGKWQEEGDRDSLLYIKKCIEYAESADPLYKIGKEI